MKYLFQKGITRSDSEYTDIDDSTIIFSFACSDCYQEAFDNSGGTYTTHRVEKRKDGFYYMLSEWRPIPKEVKTDFRPFLSEEWEKEFNIPPEIRFDDWSKKLAVGREEASLR
ncbi:MAG: hypothetical protein M1355_00545 [Patescibacteria group bacterium]|nr:hypothetical protein [Patescibacteria group bacterium]